MTELISSLQLELGHSPVDIVDYVSHFECCEADFGSLLGDIKPRLSLTMDSLRVADGVELAVLLSFDGDDTSMWFKTLSLCFSLTNQSKLGLAYFPSSGTASDNLFFRDFDEIAV